MCFLMEIMFSLIELDSTGDSLLVVTVMKMSSTLKKRNSEMAVSKKKKILAANLFGKGNIILVSKKT